MKKKAVLTVGLVLIAAFICSFMIRNVLQKREYASRYNDHFAALFVTERDAVFSLHEAIDAAIKNPDEEHYAFALSAAENAEYVCQTTFDDLRDDVTTYGAELVYYTTFYRDIKAQITSDCDVSVLEEINEMLGNILSLYDAHSDPVETADKIEAMRQFYHSISVLHWELMEFAK